MKYIKFITLSLFLILLVFGIPKYLKESQPIEDTPVDLPLITSNIYTPTNGFRENRLEIYKNGKTIIFYYYDDDWLTETREIEVNSSVNESDIYISWQEGFFVATDGKKYPNLLLEVSLSEDKVDANPVFTWELIDLTRTE